MNIQTETAIVPFQGGIQPVRSVDYRISKYSQRDRYVQGEPSYLGDDSDRLSLTYGRSGKESACGQCLGENIDIYI